MTKYHYLLTFYFFFFGLVSVNAQGCIGTSQYPLSTITPTTTWSNIAADSYAGEYAVVNVVSGNL